ncbi:hypothetical protein [Prosthecodimorpha staleyi]|uniref:Uncharacterized protein n=1 Tax=Prosthecodimorpha staleyi TaxID=2840188 RepID=A0A947DCR0_9HYPH|nr:hypothetical protein [Prosthecodimorpha staleyi]MBT9292559.1 hypothetical protein [Prosthecodimorpha staleyi]
MSEMSQRPEMRRSRPDPLLSLLAWNWLAGAVIALVLAAAVLATDVAHLRTLILNSDEPWIAVLLLVFGFLVTMCSVTMGTAIMALGRDPEAGSRPRGGVPALLGRFAPARAPAARRPGGGAARS